MRETFGVEGTRYDGPALTAFEPALKPGLAGAWHYECDAHLRPDKLMASWRQLLEKQGVTVRERCEFRGFARQGRRVTGVETSAGVIPAGAVVVAAGAWTPLLHRPLGVRLPIQPGKGYSVTMSRPARCPATPMIFEEHRVAVTPMQSGYRLGSTMEFAGYDDTLNRSRLDLLIDGASHYLVAPTAEPVQEEWWGWRPMVPDGKPVIGPTPAFDNVLVAAGHGMLGLSMAPATGRLVTELLTGRPPHIDPAPYAATRF
jgi:D-amino-acid dehydrogenase